MAGGLFYKKYIPYKTTGEKKKVKMYDFKNNFFFNYRTLYTPSSFNRLIKKSGIRIAIVWRVKSYFISYQFLERIPKDLESVALWSLLCKNVTVPKECKM